MSSSDSMLAIDGDAKLLRGVEFALKDMGRIRTASSWEEANAAMRDTAPYSVILVALTLQGMDSFLVHQWLRELHPESIVVLMVGAESMRSLGDAVNEIEPHRVIPKPFLGEAVRRVVEEAQAEYARIAQGREMLEGTLHGSLEAIAGMLAVAQPAAFGRAGRLRRMVSLLADKIGLPDKWEMQIAALLSQFGTVTLPAELVERLCRNQPVSAAEHSRMLASTEATLKLLLAIPRMARVCEILHSVDLIPTRDPRDSRKQTGDAERVLTLALDFDGLFAEHGTAREALRVMESRIGRYHMPYFDALRGIVGSKNAARLIDIPLASVRLGQVFAADVRSPNNLLLVARGQPVTPPLLLKLREQWQGFAAQTIVRVVESGGSSDRPEAGSPDAPGERAA
jgi:DNA-binding NarL/FixJ family response regulator